MSEIALTLKKHKKGHWNWQERIKLNGNDHHKQVQRFHFDISQKMTFLHAAQQPDDQMTTDFYLGWTLFLCGNWDEHFMDEHIFLQQMNTVFVVVVAALGGREMTVRTTLISLPPKATTTTMLFYNICTLIFTTDEHWLLHKPTRFLGEPVKCLKPKSSLTSGFHVYFLSPEIKRFFL